MPSTRFWIVTPAFNSLRWLPCAAASVADQAGNGIAVHHHVQDGGSTDGTREWLEAYARQCAESPRVGYTFSFESAPDRGMYDAINKGWDKAPQEADYLAHLNSDEQYLPGALQAVAAQPEADLVLGDALVVDGRGAYICHQSSVKPWPWMSRYFCVVLTCTAFYRRRFLAQAGVRFDPSWRIAGDMVFYHQLIRRGVRVSLCNRPTSVFVDSGENLAISPGHKEECVRFGREYGGRFARFARCIQKANTLRRLWKDARRGFSRGYEIYLPGEVARRTAFEIARPASLWRRKVE
ncbi:MAG: glycosyltransferase [Chthoniobacteraceae bacterium]|nr:glycosyltransferase [Chthoniobacteraceae bacterium]